MDNGALTTITPLPSSRSLCARHTNDITTKESIDPAHDQSVGNDHGHLPLHSSHHALHSVRVGHGIGWRLAPVLWGFQVSTGLVGGGEGVTAGLEGALGQNVEVGAHVDAVGQGPLLTDGFLIEGFGGRGEKDGDIVSEDSRQDLEETSMVRSVERTHTHTHNAPGGYSWFCTYHDNGNREKDPIAGRGSCLLAMAAPKPVWCFC